MKKNNKLFIKNLKSVVFFGESKNLKDFIEIKIGDRFFTPKVKIDDSMSQRIFYDYKGLN